MRAALLLVAAAWGMAAEAAPALPELRVPRAAAPPAIDGRLDDPCWAAAGVIGALQPALGQRRGPLLDRLATRIAVVWDPDALYLSFACTDDEIFAEGKAVHDGNIYLEDVCEVFLDAKGDGRQWIELQINPLNQTLDLMSLDVGSGAALPNRRLADTRDLFSFRGWEAEGWRTATGRIDGGWTVEMAIPAPVLAKRLGAKALAPGRMRANFMRYDHRPRPDGKRDLLQMNWSPVAHGCPHLSPTAMGVLELVEGP